MAKEEKEVKPNIHHKWAAVCIEMGKLPKSGYNDFHKYSYVTAEDAIGRFKELVSTAGLTVVPCLKEHRIDFADKKILVTIVMDYRVTNADDGESITFGPFIGQGIDSGGDKAPYKALTGCMKYFVLQATLTPTGDDPERTEAKQAPSRGGTGFVPGPKEILEKACLDARQKIVAPQQQKIMAPQQQKIEPRSETENIRAEAEDKIMQMQGGNVEACEKYLEQTSSFTTKEGKVVKGKRKIADLSEKWLRTTIGKIRKDYSFWAETASKLGSEKDVPQ